MTIILRLGFLVIGVSAAAIKGPTGIRDPTFYSVSVFTDQNCRGKAYSENPISNFKHHDENVFCDNRCHLWDPLQSILIEWSGTDNITGPTQFPTHDETDLDPHVLIFEKSDCTGERIHDVSIPDTQNVANTTKYCQSLPAQAKSFTLSNARACAEVAKKRKEKAIQEQNDAEALTQKYADEKVWKAGAKKVEWMREEEKKKFDDRERAKKLAPLKEKYQKLNQKQDRKKQKQDKHRWDRIQKEKAAIQKIIDDKEKARVEEVKRLREKHLLKDWQKKQDDEWNRHLEEKKVKQEEKTWEDAKRKMKEDNKEADESSRIGPQANRSFGHAVEYYKQNGKLPYPIGLIPGYIDPDVKSNAKGQ
ncbi:hypothetical protein G7046_g9970 [Stylonectria norvegica]|nr:hypothetical protein G7046_g9970 [Stylonectria norvegica]